jgi:hypothetical protein
MHSAVARLRLVIAEAEIDALAAIAPIAKDHCSGSCPSLPAEVIP